MTKCNDVLNLCGATLPERDPDEIDKFLKLVGKSLSKGQRKSIKFLQKNIYGLCLYSWDKRDAVSAIDFSNTVVFKADLFNEQFTYVIRF